MGKNDKDNPKPGAEMWRATERILTMEPKMTENGREVEGKDIS